MLTWTYLSLQNLPFIYQVNPRISRCWLLDYSLDVLNNSVSRRGRPAAPLITQVCSSALQSRIGPGSLSYVESIPRSMTPDPFAALKRDGGRWELLDRVNEGLSAWQARHIVSSM